MLAGPFQERFDFRAGLQRVELLDRWFVRGIFCNDVSRLTAARVRTGGDTIRFESAVGERLHDIRIALDAFGSEFAKGIIGPTRIAAFSGPCVSRNVDEHVVGNWMLDSGCSMLENRDPSNI